jgi:hypothetical protein
MREMRVASLRTMLAHAEWHASCCESVIYSAAPKKTRLLISPKFVCALRVCARWFYFHLVVHIWVRTRCGSLCYVLSCKKSQSQWHTFLAVRAQDDVNYARALEMSANECAAQIWISYRHSNALIILEIARGRYTPVALKDAHRCV